MSKRKKKPKRSAAEVRARQAHFQRHVADWSRKLTPINRAWVPKFAYHFTDVRNAASILTERLLRSRAAAGQANVMVNDNAAAGIISQTAPAHLKFARLYFRPRTATQWWNEGIRPPNNLNAHCPVPVFLCFDLPTLLCRDDVQFSDGNMASHYTTHDSTTEFFDTIPWHDVYSFGPIYGNTKQVTARRQAEVLIPDALEVVPETLRFVACRTAAERQTLINLITREVDQEFWEPYVKIGIEDMFFRKWAFVQSVSFTDDHITFNLHRGQWSGPLDIRFRHVSMFSGDARTWRGAWDEATLVINATPMEDGPIWLFIQNELAYHGYYETTDIPY